MRPLFLALLFLCPLFLVAQRNFQPGYVVISGSDTVRGQIDYREWGASPHSIVFQAGNSGQVTSYTAGDLKAFAVGGDVYEGHTVTIYPYSTNIEMVVNEEFSVKPYEKTIFMRQLESGKMRLYEYKDSTATNYYFAGQQGAEKPWQLRFISRRAGQDGHYGVVYDPYFRAQLGDPMGDCPQVAPLLKRAEYKLPSLRKLFFQYNHCGQDTVEKLAAKERGVLRFYPTIGLVDSKVTYTGGLSYSFPAYKGIIGGGTLLYIMPRNRGQWGFVADVLFHHFSSTSTFASLNQYINRQAKLDYTIFKLDLLFRYSLPLDGKVRPFIQAGFANSVLAGNKSYQDEYNTVGNTVTRGPFMDFRKYQPGLVFGAGMTAWRLSLEVRYDRRQFSDYNSISVDGRNFYFLAGFSL